MFAREEAHEDPRPNDASRRLFTLEKNLPYSPLPVNLEVLATSYQPSSDPRRAVR
jgi:hypothetical protein